MKKLKKRLPALLMALIIAVIPVLIAVPASAVANYVPEYQEAVLCSNGIIVDHPFNYPLGSALIVFLDGNTSCYVFEPVSRADNPFGLVLCSPLRLNDSVARCDIFGQYYVLCTLYRIVDGVANSSSLYEDVPFRSEIDCTADGQLILESIIVTGTVALQGLAGSVYSFGDTFNGEILQYPDFALSYVLLSEYEDSRVDFLNVFSGVGSFLADAVNSAATMFYTAEGGLSVLGILAVASLGLAVILLLMSLIAGWLKFK